MRHEPAQLDFFDGLVNHEREWFVSPVDRADTQCTAAALASGAARMSSPENGPSHRRPETLAAALAQPREANTLSPKELSDIRSALALVKAATGRNLQELPASAPELRAILDRVEPAGIRGRCNSGAQRGVSAKRWANAKSIVLRLPRQAGGLAADEVGDIPDQSPWNLLLRMVTDQRLRGPLRPFAQFCHARGVDPTDVTEGVLNSYVERRLQRSRRTSAAGIATNVRSAWNRAKKLYPPWPGRRLVAPTPQHVEALPLAELSDEFRVDLHKYLDRRTTGDPFDLEDNRPVRQATIKNERAQLIRAASILCKAANNSHHVRSLSDLVHPGNARAVLLHIYKRSGNIWQDHARTMATVLNRVAQSYVRVAPEHHDELQKILKAISEDLNSRRRPGLPESVQKKLGPLDDPEVRRRLFTLPGRLYERAASLYCKSPVKAALLNEAALILDILITDPIRRENLAKINIDKHVQRNQNGVIVGVYIPSREIKNGIAIEIGMVDNPSLAGRIQKQLDTFRPHICGGAGSFLFPSPCGGARNAANLAKTLSKTVRREIGVHFTPHLMRHLAATMLYEADPRNGHLVKQLLRLTTLKQAERMYGERRNRGAQYEWAKLVERMIEQA